MHIQLFLVVVKVSIFPRQISHERNVSIERILSHFCRLFNIFWITDWKEEYVQMDKILLLFSNAQFLPLYF